MWNNCTTFRVIKNVATICQMDKMGIHLDKISTLLKAIMSDNCNIQSQYLYFFQKEKFKIIRDHDFFLRNYITADVI